MSESLALRLPQPLPREERVAERETALEQRANGCFAWASVAAAPYRVRKLWPLVANVRQVMQTLSPLDDTGLRTRAVELATRLRARSTNDTGSIEALAIAVETASRTLGMRAFDCQIAGACALTRGMVIEMETGEGKTLTSALACAAVALSGTPVHAVTVNDYLAERDAAQLRPLYAFLGLTTGIVLSPDPEAARREAYRADIVHVTAKELAFDYLRDRLATGRHDGELHRQLRPLRVGAASDAVPRLRGLAMAVIDEIDSILVDEARQPLVISHQSARQTAQVDLVKAREDAGVLQAGRHFVLHVRERRAELSPAGREQLASLARGREGRWRLPAWREELVRQALAAQHLYHCNEDYVVRDQRVAIVDEHTGRVMPDRSWSAGLHELIELKEGCPPQAGRTDVARMTYQRFFRRYRRLAGMTGTAHEVARELWAIYRLPIVRLPTNRPLRRDKRGVRVVETELAKWRVLAREVKAVHDIGRPVLIGTRTVNAAHAASHALKQLGLPHALLSADQDAHEASIVADAGQPGRITIATNMAGRGTDIRLRPRPAQAGCRYRGQPCWLRS